MKGREGATLMLADGRQFSGWNFGAEGETVGEICFNTGMTGYQEILTDPSYCGQIVTMTYPHIGNYGVNPYDVESSRIQVSGLVIREEPTVPSNHRATQSVGEYLREAGIVGIQGVDTRALTRHIRAEGAMNGIISTVDRDESSLREKIRACPSMTGQDLVKQVTCTGAYDWDSPGDHASPSPWPVHGLGSHASPESPEKRIRYRVACLDFGIKWNILRLLSSHRCDIRVFPAAASAKEVLETDPDGVLLSNGPGDPEAATYAVGTVQGLLGKKPLFGICLGHQLMALALGGKTYKLKFGHHGTNHPVKHVETGNVEITSQNHGFAVDADSLPEHADVTHWNLNDETVEGLR
ncbi:MAG: glutamine-hydrolyzing carbamoyl-phosphate synthase small subunit, partial [Fidelibacterota bacterium]